MELVSSRDLELDAGWGVKTLPINFHRQLYRGATRRHFYTDCLSQLEKILTKGATDKDVKLRVAKCQG